MPSELFPYELTPEQAQLAKRKTEEEMRQLSNRVYVVACEFYEVRGERGGLLIGNGHHMAQELADRAVKIYRQHIRTQILLADKEAARCQVKS